MLGRKPTERLPWYRARDYKGDLTENEKRQLDSFRMRREHPAASYDTLPGEVKVYIGVQETKSTRTTTPPNNQKRNAYVPLDLLPHKMEEKCR
jgi:hypothetical protein